ncbi:MAG: hypothetical protein BAA01_09365 [Bacillus thermozeamaize]|uniref:Uncharacterized protein n=1 Tax=Bacillus thermozeamaize TaxID=230954 RepID=A0A1Y3PKP7_9BACI|nr:MAG: hypothetical protein BAA01_09365 [Bacillus thermozeamaize]
MDVVRVTKQVFTLTEKGTIHAGDVFLADRRLGGWMIIDGKFNGYFLHEHEAELVPEFEQMKKEVTELKKRYEQAVQVRELLQKEIDELNQERKALLLAVDKQKVVIPEEVAEAIEQIRMSGHEWELFYNDHIYQRANGSNRYFQVIADYMQKITNVKTYFSALINGYTTKEEALEEQVSHMLHEWLEAEYEGDEETDRREFAKRLVSFMRRELAQSG